jgi:hypothetical protein
MNGADARKQILSVADNRKGNDNDKRRFPSGMTKRKLFVFDGAIVRDAIFWWRMVVAGALGGRLG